MCVLVYRVSVCTVLFQVEMNEEDVDDSRQAI